MRGASAVRTSKRFGGSERRSHLAGQGALSSWVMSKNYPQLLADIDKKRDAAVSEAAAFRDQYLQATTNYVRGLYESVARSIAISESETTQSIGAERIKQLKAEIKTLQGQTPTIIQQLFEQHPYWSNTHPNPREQRPPDPAINQRLNSDLRKALGFLNPVLNNFGYKGQFGPRDGMPAYEGDLSENDEMKTIRGKYEAVQAKAEFIRTQRVNLEAEQRKAEAQKLWDSV